MPQESAGVDLTSIICNGDQVEIESSFCATSSGEENCSFVAQCPFRPTFNVINRMHSEMPSNASQLDKLMCGPYKRKGFLCSECEEGYGPAVYSIDKKCTDCSSLRSRYGISLFLFLHFVPMTLLFILLVFFNFDITSGPLLGYVIFCQISIIGVTNRNTYIYDYLQSSLSKPLRVLLNLSITLSQFWSLQFFKVMIPPFCLSDKLSGIHVALLDFIPAIYSLVLVIISCVLIKLHARNYKFVGTLFKPFKIILSKANITTVTSNAVIRAFASLIFLSNTAVLLVMSPITDTTSVQKTNGMFQKRVVYIDPSIEWPSRRAFLYLLVATAVVVTVSVIPSILLCMYPTRVYSYLSRSLSARKRLAITAFAEALHSCFTDGLNGTRDYRALAGAPLFLVLLYATVFNMLIRIISFDSSLIVGTVLWMMLACVVSYVKPCKSAIANISLSFHVTLFGVLMCTAYLWKNDLSIETYTLGVTFIATLFTPHILVAAWAGYALTRHMWTRFGHGPGCRLALRNMASGARNCLCQRHSSYQELQ